MKRSLDVFKLFGTVVIETKEAIDALEDTKDAAKETGDSVDELGNKSKKSGKTTTDSMQPVPSKLMKVVKAGAAVVTAFAAIGSAAIALAESTREYRLEMGKLETAFTIAGHTTEAATDTYRTFYSVLGETERAVEVSQHIAKLCASEEEMKTITDACIGAFALFDDSLPIEGLVEAANETAKTGQLTGVLADALNWAGSSEVEFQKRLDACNSERERAVLIMDELTDLYGDAADSYKKNNKEVLAATAAQEKLNAATARWGKIVEPAVTLFKEGLAASINFAADAFERLIDPAGAAADALIGSLETSEQAAAKVDELRKQLAELNATPAILWTDEHNKQQLQLMIAVEEAESQYRELAEAERLASAEADAAAMAAADTSAKFTDVTEQYIADATALFEKFAETYEGLYNKIAGWFNPFEEAKVSVETNVNDMMAAMQSQVDFNNAYTQSLQALKEYGLGSLADAFQSYGAEGYAYAQTIVDAVEQAGGAATEEGQKIIQGFTDINQKVTDSQGELSQTMALFNGEFEGELQRLTETYDVAVANLDKSAEASDAARSTFEAFLEGMNSKLPSIMSTMRSFGQQITSALQSGIGTVKLSVNVETNGQHKTGLDYVPFDGYIAELHKGEAVLTAAEAAVWRAGKASGEGTVSEQQQQPKSHSGITIVQNIQTVPQTPVEFAAATEAYFEQARWAMA